MPTQINQSIVLSQCLHRHRVFTLSASGAQAHNFPLSVGPIYPSGYNVAPAPQYPLVQSSTQPTVTYVYTGHLSSVLPQQSVSLMLCQLKLMVAKQMIWWGLIPFALLVLVFPRLSSIGCHSHLFSSHQEHRFILDSWWMYCHISQVAMVCQLKAVEPVL